MIYLIDPTPLQLVHYDEHQLAPYTRKRAWGMLELSRSQAQQMLAEAPPGISYVRRGNWDARVSSAYINRNRAPAAVCQVYVIMKGRVHVRVAAWTEAYVVNGRSGIAKWRYGDACAKACELVSGHYAVGGLYDRLHSAQVRERIKAALNWHQEHAKQIDRRQRPWLERMLNVNGLVDVQMLPDERGMLMAIDRRTVKRCFCIVRDATHNERIHAIAVPPETTSCTGGLAWTAQMTEAEYAQLLRENEA
jgi:hypothetical protein